MGFKNWLMGRRAKSTLPFLAEYYAEAERFADIVSGGGDWRYTRKGGLNGGTRRLASLGAARAVCAELSRLCFTEGTTVTSTDLDTERFLQEVLKENRFYERFPAFLEKVFALGGGAVKVYWDNGVKIDFVEADCFVPTKWDGRCITGATFASEVTEDNKHYWLTETQELCEDNLTIENRLYTDTGAKAVVLTTP